MLEVLDKDGGLVFTQTLIQRIHSFFLFQHVFISHVNPLWRDTHLEKPLN
jgi:hypothetical protein